MIFFYSSLKGGVRDVTPATHVGRRIVEITTGSGEIILTTLVEC
jgi:hypothetical protein